MEPTPTPARVTDHRTPPRGVLPRHVQMWVMVGLAVAILGIVAFSGQPDPPQPSTAPAARAASAPPNTDRVRDYQDRLRSLDARSRQEALPEVPPARPAPPAYNTGPAPAPSAPDPVDAERRRRDYASLFASNVVMTRRPDAQYLVQDRTPSSMNGLGVAQSAESGLPTPPTLDAVAEAVVRATSRHAQPSTAASEAISAPSNTAATLTQAQPTQRPVSTGPISSAGPLHRLLEGTVIETVLTNRLDGSAAAPVNCLVTSPIYSHDGRYVLIPAGSRVLGETRPVQSLGETRLAVAFSRLVLPDGRTHRLEQFVGLNAIGEAGLRDQVNHHYRSTFGASAAVGLISGFAQYLGALGFNRGDGDRTVVIAGNVGDATAQATNQTMSRYLNRLPTVTIREGHRVQVYLTSDLELPAYGVRSETTTPALVAATR